MAPPLTGTSLILHPPIEGEGSMKRILCSLLVATLPFGSVLADAPESKNAKVTLVYQHELPNVPGKSIKGGTPGPSQAPRPIQADNGAAARLSARMKMAAPETSRRWASVAWLRSMTPRCSC
jgi:hypothetical protein